MTNTSIASFGTFPFQGFVFFQPFVNSYTGSKRLTPEDLGFKSDDLPPEDLASLGSMHTCDPKKLAKFESARNAQRLACLQYGVQRMGAFAVPKARAIELATRLDEIKNEFYAYKSEFLKDFVSSREAWINKPAFARWTEVIRTRLHSVQYLDQQIQCGWSAFVAGSTAELPLREGESVSSLGAGSLDEAAGIGYAALSEIAVLAQALMRESLSSERTEITQKIFSPIRRMRDKLDGLSFADPRLIGVVKYINDVISALPQKGKMTGTELGAVQTLVAALGNPETILFVSKSVRQDVTITDEAAQQIGDMVATANAAPAQQQAQVTLDLVQDDLGAQASIVQANQPCFTLLDVQLVQTVAPSPVLAAPVQHYVYDDL